MQLLLRFFRDWNVCLDLDDPRTIIIILIIIIVFEWIWNNSNNNAATRALFAKSLRFVVHVV